jgi:hypothetical protein
MNIDDVYASILKELELGHRAFKKFTAPEIEELLLTFRACLSPLNSSELEKVLCLLDHSQQPNQKFEADLIQTLNLDLPDHLLVFAINASRRHIIQARFQKGHRLSFEYLEALKKLLHSRSPEVVEWTLRTIEECGNQGVYFLREFDKIKPPPWKWFNPHQRAVREIITLLERRWSPNEKSQP